MSTNPSIADLYGKLITAVFFQPHNPTLVIMVDGAMQIEIENAATTSTSPNHDRSNWIRQCVNTDYLGKRLMGIAFSDSTLCSHKGPDIVTIFTDKEDWHFKISKPKQPGEPLFKVRQTYKTSSGAPMEWKDVEKDGYPDYNCDCLILDEMDEFKVVYYYSAIEQFMYHDLNIKVDRYLEITHPDEQDDCDF